VLPGPTSSHSTDRLEIGPFPSVQPELPPDGVALGKVAVCKRRVHDCHIWRLIIVRRTKFPPVDQSQSDHLEIVWRHRAQRQLTLRPLVTCRLQLNEGQKEGGQSHA